MDFRILDIKSQLDLDHHINNLYKNKCLKGRVYHKLTNNKFSLDNIIRDDIFLCNIHNFSGFEGHYYFNGKDPLVNTSLELLNKDPNCLQSRIFGDCDLYQCKMGFSNTKNKNKYFCK